MFSIVSSRLSAARSLAVASFLMFPLTGCGGLGEHAVQPHLALAVAAPTPTDWNEVLAHPIPMDVVAYNTGYVLTGPRVLIDKNDPKTPESEKKEQWVPSLSYLVTHPTHGRFLMDAGVGAGDREGHCDFGVSPLFRIPCRAGLGQDVGSQLEADGIGPTDLSFVLLSHLHGDHAGGLAPLAQHGPFRVAVAAQEWTAASRGLRVLDGYVATQLRGGFDVETLDVDTAPNMPILGPSLDLFGDHSVWLFPTHGHSRGELSVLLNVAPRPIFMTFDAAHLKASVEREVRPGFVVDDDAATASVKRIAAFAKAFPQVQVIYGHEPSQWSDKPRRVVLASAESTTSPATL
jgi:glyoxylase-like metal-dependent hydrolase (beta-lactamase superfamily II)